MFTALLRACAQVSVFGTSVLAARAMAAAHWPGFAAGGVLWFPDLTKAAVVIHWGQVRSSDPSRILCGSRLLESQPAHPGGLKRGCRTK